MDTKTIIKNGYEHIVRKVERNNSLGSPTGELTKYGNEQRITKQSPQPCYLGVPGQALVSVRKLTKHELKKLSND